MDFGFEAAGFGTIFANDFDRHSCGTLRLNGASHVVEGPIEAIPAALKSAGLHPQDIDWFELNEAFAAQSLAVINTLQLDASKVNPMGGAIALGHPLGATGAIRAATVVHALRRHQLKYGMVTMCVGMGQGAAGIFERV